MYLLQKCQQNVQYVFKKRDQNVFYNISYKPSAILVKFGTQFPE